EAPCLWNDEPRLPYGVGVPRPPFVGPGVVVTLHDEPPRPVPADDPMDDHDTGADLSLINPISQNVAPPVRGLLVHNDQVAGVVGKKHANTTHHHITYGSAQRL